MKFWKYSALGNTFVVVPQSRGLRARQLPWVRALCSAEQGVSADGVAIIEPASRRLHIYNADGTRAEVSGNGARCAARWCFDRQTSRSEISLRADAGDLRCLRLKGRDIAVILPPPTFAASALPARTRAAELWGKRLLRPTSKGKSVIVHAVSVGNPHCVVWCSTWPRDWERTGAWLSTHRLFPDRTNVVFARPSGRTIDLRIWERGVGVTSSSGTGAAAAVVVGARLGITPRRVRVRMPGGNMKVTWKQGGEIELIAPALLVAQGLWPTPPSA